MTAIGATGAPRDSLAECDIRALHPSSPSIPDTNIDRLKDPTKRADSPWACVIAEDAFETMTVILDSYESVQATLPASADHASPVKPRMRRSREGHLFADAPFHLEATVRVLQRRASNRVDVWEHDSYVRAIETTSGSALVRVWNAGTIEKPDLRYEILAGRHSLAVHSTIRAAFTRILGLEADPTLLQRVAEVDKVLTSTVRSLRGMRPPRFATLFESFASVIPFQQLSIDAGLSILGKLVERFGEHLTYRGKRYTAFPRHSVIARAPLGGLQACGLSLKKAQTLQGVAHAIESGTLAEHSLVGMESEEALARLVELPGVGPWTAGLVLLRGLGRIDVFPSGDSGAARSLRRLIPIDEHASIDAVVASFGEVRGYLYFCCLGASLLDKGLIHPAKDPRGAARRASPRDRAG